MDEAARTAACEDAAKAAERRLGLQQARCAKLDEQLKELGARVKAAEAEATAAAAAKDKALKIVAENRANVTAEKSASNSAVQELEQKLAAQQQSHAVAVQKLEAKLDRATARCTQAEKKCADMDEQLATAWRAAESERKVRGRRARNDRSELGRALWPLRLAWVPSPRRRTPPSSG